MKNLLIIIDPQNDFVAENGSLKVDGALDDMSNVANMINQNGSFFDSIIITMDSHHPIHIASSCYWQNKLGKHPSPFTIISHEDVLKQNWQALYEPELAVEYLQKIESAGKKHTIWPTHTLIGTTGWAIYQPIYDTVYKWHFKTNKKFILYTKGENSVNSEMFSIVKPEVSFNETEDLKKTMAFIDLISQYEYIYICGEAEDFCVKESVKDIIETSCDISEKIIILTDCTSRIIENNPALDKFWYECRQKGVRFKKSTDVL